MNSKVHRTLFHWTSLLMQGGFVGAPIVVNLWRNKLNHGFNIRKMELPALPNMPDENLVNLIEAEMLFKTEERAYPFERHDFGIILKDDIESNTYGFFFCQNGVTFRFTTRLALNDVETIRRHYPNFLTLFKENLGSKWVKDFKTVKDNLRSAKGLRDFLTIFKEKDLRHLRIDTSTLSDEDLRKVLLTPNAKRFVIARELLLADSFFHGMPALDSVISFGFAWSFFSFLKLRMPEKLAIAIAFLFALVVFATLDRIDRINEFVRFDKECVEVDNVYLDGAKEYLQSSIELGKLLCRLTGGKARFDADGNYERHIMNYTERMKVIEEMEKKLTKEKGEARIKEAKKFQRMISE